MKKAALALLFAAAGGMAATASQAAVTFVGYQTALNPGEQLVTSFQGGPSLDATTLLQSGYSISGTASLFTGSTAGVAAAPALSATTYDTSQFLAVERGATATLDTPLVKEISFYVGSLDPFNSFTFHLADGATEVFTGSMLTSLTAAKDTGNQTAGNTNGRLTFIFDSPIDSIVLGSAGDSLEVADIAALPAISAIPDPASWALMIVGFGGLGLMLRRQRLATPLFG